MMDEDEIIEEEKEEEEEEELDALSFNLEDVYNVERNLRLLQENVDKNIGSILAFKNSDSNIDASGYESKISCAKGDKYCLGFQESIKEALSRTINVRNAILTSEGDSIEAYESMLEIDFDEYVKKLLYDENGNPKYPGMNVISDPTFLPNGCIQLTINVTENSTNSKGAVRNNNVTITINPYFTGRVFTLATGTNGTQFYNLVNSNAANNNFTTVSFGTAPSDTRVSDDIIKNILFESNGNNNLNVAVISGASAGVTSTINMYGELMGIVDGKITTMLLDAAYDGIDYKNTLLSRSDVVNHMKENGDVIIAYESTAPDAADKNWQELADNGITVVMCVNDSLHDHSGNKSPEMQAINGEVNDIMLPNSGLDQPIPVVHSEGTLAGPDNSGNNYGIYTPGGDGTYSGGSITDPVDKSEILDLLK